MQLRQDLSERLWLPQRVHVRLAGPATRRVARHGAIGIATEAVAPPGSRTHVIRSSSGAVARSQWYGTPATHSSCMSTWPCVTSSTSTRNNTHAPASIEPAQHTDSGSARLPALPTTSCIALCPQQLDSPVRHRVGCWASREGGGEGQKDRGHLLGTLVGGTSFLTCWGATDLDHVSAPARWPYDGVGQCLDVHQQHLAATAR